MLTAIEQVFFLNAAVMKQNVYSYWGNLERTEGALRELLHETIEFHRENRDVYCCNRQMSLTDRTVSENVNAETFDTYIRETSGGAVVIRVPFHRKQALWYELLAYHGKEYANGFVWKNFIASPGDTFWQRVVAKQSMHMIRQNAIVSTGHYLIDRSLALICTCIHRLDTAGRVWSVLELPVWEMDELPRGWTEMEERLTSYVYTCKNESVVRVVGIIRLPPEPTRTTPTFRCFQPMERNRIALLLLFERAAQFDAARRASGEAGERREEMDGVEFDEEREREVEEEGVIAQRRRQEKQEREGRRRAEWTDLNGSLTELCRALKLY